MPFTLSHAAAVLPFARSPLVPAALVAGSVAPDVPYFLPVPRHAGAWYEPFVNATVTHHWPGMVTAAVPTAVVLVGVWWLVRGPLADLVARDPGHAAVRGTDDRRGEPTAPLWGLVSVVVGVLTHVAWDAFTHGDGLLVERVAVLRAEAFAGMEWARVLQHASTVVGAVVLLGWGSRRLAGWRRAGGRLGVTRTGAAVLGVVVLLAAVAAGVPARERLADGVGVEAVVAEAVKTGGAVVALAVLTYAVVWHGLRVAREGEPEQVDAAEWTAR